jgi:serine protease AprX
MSRLGPLLQTTLARYESSGELGIVSEMGEFIDTATRRADLLPALGFAVPDALRGARIRDVDLYGKVEKGLAEIPVFATTPRIEPKHSERWEAYRERVNERLWPVRDRLQQMMGQEVEALPLSNTLRLTVSPDQARMLSTRSDLELVELDPLLQVVSMDDAAEDVAASSFRVDAEVDGTGVTVAVLDSGVDEKHPYLRVADSFSTCNEGTSLPGEHGTHCAGIIACSDATFQGIAPGVRLMNGKVLRANGRGLPTSIVKGMEAALDRGARVLSLSFSYNHFPSWSQDGHGWSCSDGRCQLCMAVDNAVLLEGVVVVVAAGNFLARANALRAHGYATSFDTELGCPGQAREALTVGAVTKRTFLPASFSSRGPTAYGANKPDLVAPGVNITSTLPVPRDQAGEPVANPTRFDLFGRKSGTSMATPIVAGVAALLIQRHLKAGMSWSPGQIRRELAAATAKLDHDVRVVGTGRIDLARL